MSFIQEPPELPVTGGNTQEKIICHTDEGTEIVVTYPVSQNLKVESTCAAIEEQTQSFLEVHGTEIAIAGLGLAIVFVLGHAYGQRDSRKI